MLKCAGCWIVSSAQYDFQFRVLSRIPSRFTSDTGTNFILSRDAISLLLREIKQVGLLTEEPAA